MLISSNFLFLPGLSIFILMTVLFYAVTTKLTLSNETDLGYRTMKIFLINTWNWRTPPSTSSSSSSGGGYSSSGGSSGGGDSGGGPGGD